MCYVNQHQIKMFLPIKMFFKICGNSDFSGTAFSIICCLLILDIGKLSSLHCCRVLKHFVLLISFRAVHILPNKFLGTIGEHEDFPIDRICLSHNGCIIGSCSHDQRVKFWNISHLREMNLEEASSSHKEEQEDTSDNFFADL